jgi:hypothetical protein
MQTTETLADLLNEIGGEPLADSGFENEVSEADFVREEV